MNKLEILLVSIVILMVGALIYVNVTKFTINEKYDYCLEWEQGIARDELVWRCYNFREQKILCDWDVTTDQKLVMYSANVSDEVIGEYQCVKYAHVKETPIEYMTLPGASGYVEEVIDNVTEP
jgi:hypothetical protein